MKLSSNKGGFTKIQQVARGAAKQVGQVASRSWYAARAGFQNTPYVPSNRAYSMAYGVGRAAASTMNFVMHVPQYVKNGVYKARGWLIEVRNGAARALQAAGKATVAAYRAAVNFIVSQAKRATGAVGRWARQVGPKVKRKVGSAIQRAATAVDNFYVKAADRVTKGAKTTNMFGHKLSAKKIAANEERRAAKVRLRASRWETATVALAGYGIATGLHSKWARSEED